MTVARASDLPHKIKKPERNEHATGNYWKGLTDTAIDRHAAPNDEHPQRNCEKHVTRSGHSGNCERLRLLPMLRSRGDYERQPMRRDSGVEERDRKPRNNEGDEDEIIHLRNNLTISKAFEELTRQPSVATLASASLYCSRGHDFCALLRDWCAMAGAPIHRLDSHDRRLFKKRVAVPSNCQNTGRCAPVFSLSDRQQGQNGGKEIGSPTSDAEGRHDLSGKRNHSSPVLRTFQLRDY